MVCCYETTGVVIVALNLMSVKKVSRSVEAHEAVSESLYQGGWRGAEASRQPATTSRARCMQVTHHSGINSPEGGRST
jgi:hypothetical protein